MLRWMKGIKRVKKIGSEELRARAGVANINENMREAIPRLFGHVERKTEEVDSPSGHYCPTRLHYPC